MPSMLPTTFQQVSAPDNYGAESLINLMGKAPNQANDISTLVNSLKNIENNNIKAEIQNLVDTNAANGMNRAKLYSLLTDKGYSPRQLLNADAKGLINSAVTSQENDLKALREAEAHTMSMNTQQEALEHARRYNPLLQEKLTQEIKENALKAQREAEAHRIAMETQKEALDFAKGNNPLKIKAAQQEIESGALELEKTKQEQINKQQTERVVSGLKEAIVNDPHYGAQLFMETPQVKEIMDSNPAVKEAVSDYLIKGNVDLYSLEPAPDKDIKLAPDLDFTGARATNNMLKSQGISLGMLADVDANGNPKYATVNDWINDVIATHYPKNEKEAAKFRVRTNELLRIYASELAKNGQGNIPPEEAFLKLVVPLVGKTIPSSLPFFDVSLDYDKDQFRILAHNQIDTWNKTYQYFNALKASQDLIDKATNENIGAAFLTEKQAIEEDHRKRLERAGDDSTKIRNANRIFTTQVKAFNKKYEPYFQAAAALTIKPEDENNVKAPSKNARQLLSMLKMQGKAREKDLEGIQLKRAEQAARVAPSETASKVKKIVDEGMKTGNIFDTFKEANRAFLYMP